jgi:hypothetical protein
VDYTFIPGTEHDESKILTITTPECFDLRWLLSGDESNK